MNPHWSRRKFLRGLAALGAAASLSGLRSAGAASDSDKLGIVLPKRKLGRADVQVTMLGLGGYHAGVPDDPGSQAMIEAAIEGGIRLFDNAESYHEGGSEVKYGKFLCPKYREHIFLTTKSTATDAATAQKHLEGSLSRMKTDYLDLWIVHAVSSADDARKRKENGVFDVFAEAKASGKVRHIGFSGHSRPSGHLEMLKLSDQFEMCQMPINALDPGYESFILQVLPELVKREMAPFAMKTLSHGGFFGLNTWAHKPTGKDALVPGRISVRDALHFVWSLPVTTLVTGPDDVAQLKEKVDLARAYEGMTNAQRAEVMGRIMDLAGREVEFYKA